MQDQRAYLKVKIKSLAEEARIIRREEQKPHGNANENGFNAIRNGLYLHRVGTVRKEARHALLAYGFIRGRKYRQMEAYCESKPNWTAVERMVVKYGRRECEKEYLRATETKAAKEELLKRFEVWREA